MINQTYHPGIVSIFEKTKESLAKQGDNDAVKAVDIFLSGAFGSGFLYNDARGNLYVITNNHVISQARTLSITFERTDGTKRKIENLRVIAADEENDLAILAIPAGGTRPFAAQGLTLLSRGAIGGEDVFSAGFPGIGATAVWQFGRGMVSNSNARIPKSFLDETLMGSFIQHTAQVDSGNSGGPLLVQQSGSPSSYIENSLRAGGAINASVKEVTGSGEEYTVVFLVNNKEVSSKWVREYGNWRIRSFGEVAAGDKELLTKKREKKERDAKLGLDNDFYMEAGYAYMFDRPPSSNAIYASFTYSYYLFNFYYIDSDYWDLGFGFTVNRGFAAGNFGLIPRLDLGFTYRKMPSIAGSGNFGFPLSMFVRPGIKITSSYVPGLYLGIGFQYMFFNLSRRDYESKEKMSLSFAVGYAF